MGQRRPSPVLIALAVAVAAVLAALLALRSCGDDAAPVPVVAPPPAEPAVPRHPTTRTPRPSAASADAATAAADAGAGTDVLLDDRPPTPAEVLREVAARPKPLVLVVTCGGRPVEKCAFAVERPSGGPRLVGEHSAAAGGRYELHAEADVALPAGVLVRAPGWAEVRVEVAARDTPVEVRLPEGGRVTGRVRRPSGEAMGGVRVHLAGRVTNADADGRFVLPDVALGRHERVTVSWDLISRSVPCEIELTRPGETRDVSVVVVEAVSLRVRVVRAADGAPIAGVHVIADARLGADVVRDMKDTDAEGRVELTGLRDGDYRVYAWGDEIEVAANHRVEVPRDEELVLRAVPYVLRRCAGRVVDSAGKPIAGATVRLYVEHWANQHRCVTGKDGAFAFDGMRSFWWGKGANAPKLEPGTEILGMSVGVGKDGADGLHVWGRFGDDLEIVLAAKCTISFVVKDASGAPLPDLHLEYRTPDGGVRSRDVKIDGKASFRRIAWYGRLAIPGQLVIQCADRRTISLDVTPKGKDTYLGEVLLAPSGVLRLVVTPPLDGLAVDVARRVAGDDGRQVAEPVGSAIRKGGAFDLPAIGAGAHRLVLSAPGRVPVDVGDVTIRANETTSLTVTLPRPASLSVLVRRGDRVVPGATVAVECLDAPPGAEEFRRTPHPGFDRRDDDPTLDRTATTSALGLARFSRLAPCRVRITVTEVGDRPRVVERALADGERATAEIDLAE